MNTLPNHTLQLNNDLLPMFAGIDRADRWLQVALPVARNHPEYAEGLEQQAASKFSGSELVKVRRQFEALRINLIMTSSVRRRSR